jgi:hypothetical protein
MNTMVPDDEQDGSKTVHSWLYPKILLSKTPYLYFLQGTLLFFCVYTH